MVLARETGEIFVEGGLTAAESGAVVVTARRFDVPVILDARFLLKFS